MSTTKATTETAPRTLAEGAGVCGIAGGALWFLSGIAGILFPQLNEPGTTAFLIGGVVATISLVLLLICFLALAWSDALGGRLGRAVFTVAMLGYALMVVGAVQTIAGVGPLIDPEAGVALTYLLGRLVAAIFTLLTGIAVLAARRWRGWAMFTPLLLGLCPLIGELGSVLVFGQPNQVLNAAWGLFGALLGYAVLSSAREQQGARLVRSWRRKNVPTSQ